MIMYEEYRDPFICDLTPLVLGLALGGLAAAGVGAATGLFGGSSTPTASPTAPPPPPPPQAQPVGAQAAGATPTPTFVGASAVPQSAFGQKTLLGQ